jgi:hypothetical protein
MDNIDNDIAASAAVIDMTWLPLSLRPHQQLVVPSTLAEIGLTSNGGIHLAMLEPLHIIELTHDMILVFEDEEYRVRDVCRNTFGDEWVRNRHGLWKSVPNMDHVQVCRDAAPDTFSIRIRQSNAQVGELWTYECMVIPPKKVIDVI